MIIYLLVVCLVRLVGGSNRFQGDIEIFNRQSLQWEQVCDDGWNFKAATVVCRQLNFGPPVSIYSHSTGRLHFPRGRFHVPYGIENITCHGTESNVGQCNYTTNHDCVAFETAGVVCSPRKYITTNKKIIHLYIDMLCCCHDPPLTKTKEENKFSRLNNSMTISHKHVEMRLDHAIMH